MPDRPLLRWVVGWVLVSVAALAGSSHLRPPEVLGSGSGVCVNEFLPKICSPSGGLYEFVELYNAGASVVDIGRWALQVTPGGRYTFPAGTQLAPGAFLVVTGLALPDGSATVSLEDAAGWLVESHVYNAPACNLAHGRLPDGSAYWNEGLVPSPGEPNAAAAPTPTASSTPTSTPTATRTPMPTSTPTSTRTPTWTRTPTRTAVAPSTATPIPSATFTPWPPLSPTPEVDVCLSEFMPAPRAVDWDGDGVADHRDEWIELHNPSAVDVRLEGWVLDDRADGGSRPYVFPADVILPARGYGVYFLRDTGVILNNDGDEIRLLAPDGRLVDEVSYRSAAYDVAYSRAHGCGSPWVASLPPSPGRANGWRLYLPFLQGRSS